ncbi:MAG TPA: VOC family protein [Candidatus Dormibacteraeota bacterium]|nr:VOC family protein [Candidatus Dormibacteraeota bacterium]
MPRPNLRVTSVTIGSSQPRELGRFYANLLGWPVTASDPPRPGMPEQAGWAQIKPPPDGTGPTLNFEYERCFQRPVWPAEEGKQTASQHLDIRVDDLAAAVNFAESQGARLAAFQPQDRVRVMIDPDGHPFCLFL